ncbi:hypothetical protein TRFO_40435 [Tritrichomonas foetus]|uniref:Viral A-type inclusion protein n=1 Tax=Tritrichomonas foetus TaxID=1144522 RepID=A0A1J4J7Q6_9EUKA|nr:hypothetical protein TRFO_40435 [Tritrichomonas foetus]|eukprot:OHS93260.1 hypothetical protein TRFO_40435 [Tritrichomonas foetus]
MTFQNALKLTQKFINVHLKILSIFEFKQTVYNSTKMTERIHETPEFTGLSHFLAKLSERNKDSEVMTKQQIQRLKSLLITIISKVQTNIETSENIDKPSENLNFLLSAMSTCLKQNPYRDLEEKIFQLEDENAQLKNGLMDDQQDVIINAESALISRIVDNLDTQMQISNEEELAQFVQQRTNKYQQLISNIIKHFNLPESTKGIDLIDALDKHFQQNVSKSENKNAQNDKEKIELADKSDKHLENEDNMPSDKKDYKAEAKSKEITEEDMNAAFREELLKTTNRLLSVQTELENLKKTIENKNEHIRRLRDERNSAKQQLKEALASVEEKSSDHPENNELISARIESVKAELLTANIENDKKARKIDKLKNYIRSIEEKVGELQEQIGILESEKIAAKEQQEQLDLLNSSKLLSTQKAIAENENEFADLKRKLEKKNSELLMMHKVFEELNQQYNQQIEELAEESTARAILVSSIQKLDWSCQDLEKRLETSLHKNSELTRRVEELTNKVKEQENEQIKSPYSTVHQSLDLSFLKSIQKISEEALPELSKQISEISGDEAVSPSQRVLHLFSFIVESFKRKCRNGNYIFDTDSDPNTTTKFYSAAISQLRFIEELVNSRDIQAWVIGDERMEESRARLQTQCVRMESFLADNCHGLIRQSNLFDYLMIHSDPMTLSSHITEFIDQYKEPKTSEGKELFLMLLQALTANDVLQKYASEAKANYDEQNKEFRNLRIAYENSYGNSFTHSVGNNFGNTFGNSLNSSFANHENPELSQQRRGDNTSFDLPKNDVSLVEAIRSTIRNAIGNGKDLQTLLKCLDKLDSVAFDQDTYVKKIEKRLSQEITENQKTKTKLDTMATEATNELSILKKKMNKINNECQQKATDLEKKNKELQNTVNEKEQIIEKLQTELGLSNTQYESLLKEHNSAPSQKALDIQREFEETRRQYDEIVKELKNEVTEMQKRVEISQREARERVSEIKSSSKKKQAKLATAVKFLQNKYEKSESEHAAKMSELTKKCEISQSSEEAAVKEAQKLKDEISEMKSKISNLSVELKMMNTRLQSKDEKMKREKALFESQLKLKVFTLESDSKTKIETVKNEMNMKNQEFLTKICRMFREMVDVNQYVDENTVEQVLTKVRSRLTTLDKDSFAADEANHEISLIKQILGPIKYIKVSTAINELVENKKQLELELQKLDSENKLFKKDINEARSILSQNSSNKEWEDWAKKLYSLVSDGFCFVKTPKEIRSAVEEVVFAAVGNKIVWRRLDCLRAEKKLILAGAMRIRSKPGPPSIRQLMTIAIIIERLQKLSGHCKSNMAIHRDGNLRNPEPLKREERPKRNKPAVVSNPRTPLFSKFVVQQHFNNE